MSDHAYAYLAAAAGLLVLAVIILTAAGRARRRDTRQEKALALAIEDERADPGDDLIPGLADGVDKHFADLARDLGYNTTPAAARPAHVACRTAYLRGDRVTPCAYCTVLLDILEGRRPR
jgi:hypothetical protein